MLQFHKSWLSADEATQLFDMTLALPLEQRYAVFGGKPVAMPRLIGWCNDLGFWLPIFWPRDASNALARAINRNS